MYLHAVDYLRQGQVQQRRDKQHVQSAPLSALFAVAPVHLLRDPAPVLGAYLGHQLAQSRVFLNLPWSFDYIGIEYTLPAMQTLRRALARDTRRDLFPIFASVDRDRFA